MYFQHCQHRGCQACYTLKRSIIQHWENSQLQRGSHVCKRWYCHTLITVARSCRSRWRIRLPNLPFKSLSFSPLTMISIWVCGTQASPISGHSWVSNRVQSTDSLVEILEAFAGLDPSSWLLISLVSTDLSLLFQEIFSHLLINVTICLLTSIDLTSNTTEGSSNCFTHCH